MIDFIENYWPILLGVILGILTSLFFRKLTKELLPKYFQRFKDWKDDPLFTWVKADEIATKTLEASLGKQFLSALSIEDIEALHIKQKGLRKRWRFLANGNLVLFFLLFLAVLNANTDISNLLEYGVYGLTLGDIVKNEEILILITALFSLFMQFTNTALKGIMQTKNYFIENFPDKKKKEILKIRYRSKFGFSVNYFTNLFKFKIYTAPITIAAFIGLIIFIPILLIIVVLSLIELGIFYYLSIHVWSDPSFASLPSKIIIVISLYLYTSMFILGQMLGAKMRVIDIKTVERFKGKKEDEIIYEYGKIIEQRRQQAKKKQKHKKAKKKTGKNRINRGKSG